MAEVPNAGLPNPEPLPCGVAVAVLAVLPVCCPNRLGAVLAATCPNTGVAEGAVAGLLASWLKAELELAAGGWVKTEEPEVTVPNTAASAAGPGVALETALVAVGALGVSAVTGPALGAAAAVTAVGPGAEREGAGEAASALTSGTPAAAGSASAEGARRLVLVAAAPGPLPTGWAGTGSFLAASGVCRGAWGGRADGCGPGSGAVDAETSLLPGFSGTDGDVASSVPLAEDAGGAGVGAELRRPPNDTTGKDVGWEVAEVADGGADGGAA